MVKKKVKKNKSKQKKKLSRSELEEYIKMASSGKGKKFLLGVRMLGGMPSASMGGGPGTHPPM